MKKGFTLIEIIVVIAIIAVLSGIILFGVTQYINKGKDASLYGNLVILIPAGETYYNGNNNSYNNGTKDFCNPQQNSVLANALSQMPSKTSGDCFGGTIDKPAEWTATSNPKGVCCYSSDSPQAWSACAKEFLNTNKIYCVDSAGRKEELDGSCASNNVQTFRCP